jgi:hypothetical protein
MARSVDAGLVSGKGEVDFGPGPVRSQLNVMEPEPLTNRRVGQWSWTDLGGARAVDLTLSGVFESQFEGRDLENNAND